MDKVMTQEEIVSDIKMIIESAQYDRQGFNAELALAKTIMNLQWLAKKIESKDDLASIIEEVICNSVNDHK